MPDGADANLFERMLDVGTFLESVAIKHDGCLFERHSVLAQIGHRLLGIPEVFPRHRETVAMGPYVVIIT